MEIKITPFAYAIAGYDPIINWNRNDRPLDRLSNFSVSLEHFLTLPITLQHYLGKKKAAELSPLLFVAEFPHSLFKEIQDLLPRIDISILDTNKYTVSLVLLSGSMYDWIMLVEYSTADDEIISKIKDQLRATGVLRWWQAV